MKSWVTEAYSTYMKPYQHSEHYFKLAKVCAAFSQHTIYKTLF